MTIDPDEHTRRLADQDATGWFETLYRQAARGEAQVPWDRGMPHPLLVDRVEGWPDGSGRSAVVVGCGLGFDAELIASLGFATTAFDVAPSAVEAAAARHPASEVSYVVADLLDLPEEWHHGFDLVVEIMTVQALPRRLRSDVTSAVASLVAPGGRLLVIAVMLTDGEDRDDGPPWPLTEPEVRAFGTADLDVVAVEPHHTASVLGGARDIHRWRAEFARPPAPAG